MTSGDPAERDWKPPRRARTVDEARDAARGADGTTADAGSTEPPTSTRVDSPEPAAGSRGSGRGRGSQGGAEGGGARDTGSARSERRGERWGTDHPGQPDEAWGRDPDRGDHGKRSSGQAGSGEADGHRRGESTGAGDDTRSDEERRGDGRPDDHERHGESTGKGGAGDGAGGTAKRRRQASRNLRTTGPLVTHFSGRVVQVFGSSQRPKPGYGPLLAACILLVGILALPLFLVALPYLALAWLGWMWLRHRGWIRGGGGRWGQGRSPRPEAMHQVTSFRVQIYDDQPPHKEVAALDCRLVQPASLGPTPLVGGELVMGQGYRFGRKMVEVTGLNVGTAKTRLRTAHPKSASSVVLPALLITAVAAALVVVQWEYLVELTTASLAATGSTVLSVLIPIIGLVIAWKLFWFMRPWR